MDLRELKALEIAARTQITCESGIWSVPSQSGNGKYRVVLKADGSTCTCDDFTLRGPLGPCKHILAVQLVRERDHGGKPLPLDTDTIPKKPTCKQNWPAYNLAQTTEKHRLQVLLAELCASVENPPRDPKPGRRPLPLGDAVFAATFKIYSTFSSRRFSCDLADAHAKGYTSRPIHYNSVNAYLEDERLTPILKALIVQASTPLRAVETTFAPDSSGFTTSRFVKWFDHK